MEWFEALQAFGWLFCCFGMVQQDQHDIRATWKRNVNIAHALFLMHQRAITVPMRNKYGVNALGVPCAFAFLLMMLWYVATHDNLMLIWIGIWLLYQLKNRAQSIRLSASIHSHYDGWPQAIRYCKSEKTAKLIVEPLQVGLLGIVLFIIYQNMGWRPTGLPYFFLSGVVSLPFVESVRQTAWNRRIQAMHDAQLDNEMAMQDFRDQYQR